MKKKRFFKKSAIFALIFLLMLSVFCFTVHAAPDGGNPDGDGSISDQGDSGTGASESGDDGSGGDSGDSGDDGSGGITDDPDVSDPTESAETPTEETDEDYLDGTVAAESDYTEPEHLDELDPVEPQDVVPATAVTVPPAQVSDASLLSGIVMWLCVAVGIAVVVGVMVSKRTRRRGG